MLPTMLLLLLGFLWFLAVVWAVLFERARAAALGPLSLLLSLPLFLLVGPGREEGSREQ